MNDYAKGPSPKKMCLGLKKWLEVTKEPQEETPNQDVDRIERTITSVNRGNKDFSYELLWLNKRIAFLTLLRQRRLAGDVVLRSVDVSQLAMKLDGQIGFKDKKNED